MGIFTLLGFTLAEAGARKPLAPSGLSNVYEAKLITSEGQPYLSEQLRGKVLMIANTASECGYTPQYQGLQSLYEKYKDQGFLVLGFPSNDFGHQEPGTNAEIRKFCVTNYKVSFPLFAKISVSGSEAHPLFRWLVEQSPKAGEVSWNFEKFLVSRKGELVERFPSRKRPGELDVIDKIEQELKKK